MTVFRLADHRVVPWKNGRGVTTEIAIHPPGATVQGGFDWRLSIAAIDEDGPFSSFPGVDRTLVLLDGEGVDLVSPERADRLVRHALSRFPGELAITARLHAGPVRDLNLMVRRAAHAHTAEVLAVRGPTDLGAGAPLLVVALDGRPTVAGVTLAPGEAVAASGPLTADGEGTLLVARLAPRLE